MQIIKDRNIIEDAWEHLCDESLPPDGKVTVAFNRWVAERNELLAREGEIGVRLSCESLNDLHTLADDLNQLQLVVLEISKFTDGRAFSFARLLRSRYGFEGEVRVRGDFLYDQVFYLQRVGVNAFEYAGPEPLENVLEAFGTFSLKYQPAADGPGLMQERRLSG